MVKSIGVSDSPPRIYVLNCGRRVVLVSAVASPALATSSALICTFRLSFNASATASFRVKTWAGHKIQAKRNKAATFILSFSKLCANYNAVHDMGAFRTAPFLCGQRGENRQRF